MLPRPLFFPAYYLRRPCLPTIPAGIWIKPNIQFQLPVSKKEFFMSGDLKIAAQLLAAEGQSLIVVRNGRMLFSSRLPGIQPLLDALDNNVLPGSAVADKVLGRAAAMIVVLGQVTAVHTPVMSQEAAEVLSEAGILYCAGRMVQQILDSEGTGPCPMEAATEFTVVPEKGVNAVRKLLKDLHSVAPPHQVH